MWRPTPTAEELGLLAWLPSKSIEAETATSASEEETAEETATATSSGEESTTVLKATKSKEGICDSAIVVCT